MTTTPEVGIIELRNGNEVITNVLDNSNWSYNPNEFWVRLVPRNVKDKPNLRELIKMECTLKEINYLPVIEDLTQGFMQLDPVVKYTYDKMKSIEEQFDRDSQEFEFAHDYYQEAYQEWYKLVEVKYYCYLLNEGMKFNIDYFQYRKGYRWAKRLGFRDVKLIL
ncbi:hypothetical protein [Rossellomorea sp. DA94]|uniref:hypothetical protein n=1 Tax=Rossellomorea sp. DA94 TaxID=3038653 RepID=UPI00244A4750|nr:hypothetical protein [Rossellomorea sp. DA94]WGG47661.1 hypothetical protein P8596_10825 [Rossellomorea sp. DA94]